MVSVRSGGTTVAGASFRDPPSWTCSPCVLTPKDLPQELQSCPGTTSFGPRTWSEHRVFLEARSQLHSGWAPAALIAAARQLSTHYPLRPGAWIRLGPRWGITCELQPGSVWPYLSRFARRHHDSPPRKLQEAATLALADTAVSWAFNLNWGPEYVSRPWPGHPHRHRARLVLRLPRERLARFLWHFCPAYGSSHATVDLCAHYNQKLGGAETVVLQLVPTALLSVSWEHVPLHDMPLEPASAETCPYLRQNGECAFTLCWESMPSHWLPHTASPPSCPYLTRLTGAGWKVSFPWKCSR